MIQTAISGGFIRGAYTDFFSTSGSLINNALYSCINYEIDQTSIRGLRETYEGPDLYDWPNFSGSYNYTLDGTGVDYIVVDNSVINPFHYDFYDVEGSSSRFNSINWGEYLGLNPNDFSNENGRRDTLFTSSYHYFPNIQAVENAYTSSEGRDYGHGMACLSIGAGKIYGWAKNAQIYYLSTNFPNPEPGDYNLGFDTSFRWDIIRKFHESKSIDPNTGFKRPTIVNASIGNLFSLNTFVDSSFECLGIYYSGSYYEGAIPSLEYGFPRLPPNNTDLNNLLGISIPSYNEDEALSVKNMTDAGVILIHASMNEYTPTYRANLTESISYNIPERYRSIHYDNYISFSGGFNTDKIYYNRTPTPTSLGSVEVGSLSRLPYSGSSNEVIVLSSSNNINSLDTIEWPSIFNNMGGGTDIFAPGEFITCAWHQYTPPQTVYKEYHNSPYLPNTGRAPNPADTVINPNTAISTPLPGSSFASPQVAGVACLYFQLNPGADVWQFKQFLLDNSKPVRRSPIEEMGVTDNWVYRNRMVEDNKEYPVLYGAPTAALFWPYSSPLTATYSEIKITKS